MFSKTKKASKIYESHFDENFYFERTQRNHYWLGGLEGQKRLQDLRVGIAGLGGMGSNLAEIFVRLGVGHIKIADPDTIDVSNLNRQVIAHSGTVGMKKAEASAKELREIAKDFELVVYDDGITEDNATEFVSDLDLVIDEIDVFPLKAHVWLHQAANQKNIPLYSAFIIGLGTHFYKFQGTDYTFEDFMANNNIQIEEPSVDFLLDRFIQSGPSYLTPEKLNEFAEQVASGRVPIFGTSTYMAQSLVAIRVIADHLNLNDQLGGRSTPIMPDYLKLDPLDLSFHMETMENVPRPIHARTC
jgi:molybdopterin/thiamine biosynthesis adenylyltransferase